MYPSLDLNSHVGLMVSTTNIVMNWGVAGGRISALCGKVSGELYMYRYNGFNMKCWFVGINNQQCQELGCSWRGDQCLEISDLCGKVSAGLVRYNGPNHPHWFERMHILDGQELFVGALFIYAKISSLGIYNLSQVG